MDNKEKKTKDDKEKIMSIDLDKLEEEMNNQKKKSKKCIIDLDKLEEECRR